jgi:hypothetical protein
MSQSLINASLFINDSCTSGTTSWEDKSENANYEKISSEEEIYLIKTDNGSYELHRKNLINTLIELKKHAHVFVSKLGPAESDMLKSTIEATRILYNSKALKDLVLTDIREIFGDVKNPIPGSLSAYFTGCFNDDNFNGPVLACNPRCAASALGSDQGLECIDSVLIFSNGTFNKLNDKKSFHAYIYIEDDKFTTFSSYHIKLLNDAGITTVTLIYGNKDGSYREVTGRLALDQMLTQPDSNSSAWPGIIIVIVIIVILILLGAMFYYKGYM